MAQRTIEPTESTRASLLARVRDARDAEAWRAFERRYGPLVVGYCLRRGMQISDAEDVRQAVMMSLSGALHRGTLAYAPERGRFRDYLGTVTRRAAARHRMRHDCTPLGLSMDTPAAEPEDPGTDGGDAAWELEWVRHHCRRAMESLREVESSRNVAAFDLLMTGMDAASVGAAMDLTPEAVRKIKQRIRGRLREIVASQIREEEGGEGRRTEGG